MPKIEQVITESVPTQEHLLQVYIINTVSLFNQKMKPEIKYAQSNCNGSN